MTYLPFTLLSVDNAVSDAVHDRKIAMISRVTSFAQNRIPRRLLISWGSAGESQNRAHYAHLTIGD